MRYLKIDRDELSLEDVIGALEMIVDSIKKGYYKGYGWELTGEDEPEGEEAEE